MAQPLHLLVDRGVLLDVGVRLRYVGLGLVVVVVRDEVLDGVVRQELAELVRQLGGERLVGCHHQRGPLELLDHPGGGRRLAGSGRAEQHDVLLTCTDALLQLGDGRRLVTAGRVGADDLERRHRAFDLRYGPHGSTVRPSTDTPCSRGPSDSYGSGPFVVVRWRPRDLQPHDRGTRLSLKARRKPQSRTRTAATNAAPHPFEAGAGLTTEENAHVRPTRSRGHRRLPGTHPHRVRRDGRLRDPGPDWFSNPIVYAHRGPRRTPRKTRWKRSTSPCAWASPGWRTTSSAPRTASWW